MPSLNDQQRRFVDEYLIDRNSARAAVAAGYSEKTARVIGLRLLKHAGVRALIERRVKENDEKLEVTADRVLKETAAIAFCTAAEIALYSPKEPRDFDSLPENIRLAVQEWQCVGIGAFTPVAPTVADVTRALGQLLAYLGLIGGRRNEPGLEAGLVGLAERLEQAHQNEDEKERTGCAAEAAPEAAPEISGHRLLFCEEYLLDQDATRAAIAAGYSEKTARAVGLRLLADEDIENYLAVRAKDIAERLNITPERVRKRIAAIAFFNGTEMVKYQLRKPADICALPENLRLAIPGWKRDAFGMFAPLLPTVADKARALKLLMRLDNSEPEASPLEARLERAHTRVAALDGERARARDCPEDIAPPL